LTTSEPEQPESAEAPEQPAPTGPPVHYAAPYPQPPYAQQQWPGYWYPPMGPPGPPPRRRLSGGRIAIIVAAVAVYVLIMIGSIAFGVLGGLGAFQGNLSVGDCINDNLGNSSQFTSNKVSCDDVTAAYRVIGTVDPPAGTSDHQACLNAFSRTEAEFQNTHPSGYGTVYCLVHVNR
jgi:hypothetical protein